MPSESYNHVIGPASERKWVAAGLGTLSLLANEASNTLELIYLFGPYATDISRPAY